jgi:hypothetical protein
LKADSALDVSKAESTLGVEKAELASAVSKLFASETSAVISTSVCFAEVATVRMTC